MRREELVGVRGSEEKWRVGPKGIATGEADICLISVNQAVARLSLLGFEELDTHKVCRIRGYARDNVGPGAALREPDEGLSIIHESSAGINVQVLVVLLFGEVEQLSAVGVDPHGRESLVGSLGNGRLRVVERLQFVVGIQVVVAIQIQVAMDHLQ